MQRWLLYFLLILSYLIAATGWAEEHVSIEGTLLMMDDATPHVAVVVQAVSDGKVMATALSDVRGKYQFIDLKSGRCQVRCYTLDGYVYYAAGKDKAEDISQATYLNTQRGKTLRNIDFRFDPFKKGIWKTYTYLDGLADNSVLAIHRDRDNVLWIGTDVGVSRYDGKEFVNFTSRDGLAHDQVGAIYSAPDGTMWFSMGMYSTGTGVTRYDGREFVNFTIEDGLAHNSVWAIHCDSNGVMWFGTDDGGVSRYDGKTFANFTIEDGLAQNWVQSIYSDPDGVMWFGTYGGVSRYDGKEFINLTTQDGLVHDNVKAIHCDPDGVVWCGTDGGVSRYDGKEFVNFTVQDGLVHNEIHAIYRDPDGVMWFGTKGGISRYDGKGFINFTTQDGLAHNIVNAICADTDGAMWFATEQGGISKYSEAAFSNLTTRDGLVNNFVHAAHLDQDGVMWFGTNGGVSRYDGKKFVNLTARDGLAKNVVMSIYRDPDGEMWFGMRGAVSRYDGESFSNLTQEDGLFRGFIQAIYRDKNGVMWFLGLGAGIYRYDGKEIVRFTTEDGLAGNAVRAIHCDPDGVLWFATDGGISRYDGKGFVNITREHGLVNNLVRAIHRDPDGTFWFGTQGGVSRYDGEKFTNFTTEDGLVHNRVEFVYRTADGVLCFATGGGGVSLFDGDTWTSLDTRDGLAGDNVYEVLESADGSLIFATNGGVTQYRRNTKPPEVRVTSVRVGKKRYTDLAEIPASTVGSDLIIECSALDFKTVPEKRQYRYRLKKLDSDWRKPTKSPEFEWTPEESGTYTFEVQAIDRDLNYSEPASLELKILPPPFYKRAGFIIGTILAAFFVPTVVLGTMLIRQKKKQAFESISNPYIVGNPIRTKEMFFGRQSDFEFVRAKLAGGQSGQVIVFAGERRSGKTSILFQILGGALGEQFVPVLMDMQAMTVDSEAEFLEKMASGIDESLVEAGYSLSPESLDFHIGNPTRIFERFMAQVMEALGDKSLLLLFDEYELIETKMDDGVLRPDIITFFASQLEAHPRLSFIFTGSRHLEGRNAEYWSILIGKSLYRRISFLSESDALRLITEPVEGVVVYPRGIPERMVRLSAGQPFYTQVMCQNMMDRLNEVERDRVRQEDVDAVAQELADNPLPQMIYFWSELEREQQGALSLLGEALQDPNGYASAQTLLNFVQEQKLGLEFQLSDLERALNDLFANEVLERERAGEGQYEYRFRADLFRLWVRQAHSVWE